MQKIQLNLSVDQVNQLLDSLGQTPYVKVYQLINEIRYQAQSQLAPALALPLQGERKSKNGLGK